MQTVLRPLLAGIRNYPPEARHAGHIAPLHSSCFYAPYLMAVRLSTLFPRLTPVDECAESGRSYNVDRAVFVQIYSKQVRARSRMIVNEFGHKLCSSRRFGITYCLA